MDLISRHHIEKMIVGVSLNPLITFSTNLNHLEIQEELTDHKFFMNNEWSPLSEVLRNPPLIIPPYLTHSPLLNLGNIKDSLESILVGYTS